MKKFLFVVVVLAVLSVYQLRKWSVAEGPLTQAGNVVVAKGATLTSVAQTLNEANVIDKPWLFKILSRFEGLDKKLRAGEYRFDAGVSIRQVMDKIARGEVFYRRMTFAEGLTTGQMLYQIATNQGLSGEVSLDVAEGSMLPETYTFELGTHQNSIVLEAQKAMNKVLDEAWDGRDVGLPYKDKMQLLTMASIIEKETGVADERPLVASVFVNRLRKGMKLQTDPTVIYALTEGQMELGRSLKKKDLAIDSPYNTYKYYGLPPAPICNPGRDAIMAAAHPAQSDYLYFVATGDGGHKFSKSLNEHNRNVKEWLKKILSRN